MASNGWLEIQKLSYPVGERIVNGEAGKVSEYMASASMEHNHKKPKDSLEAQAALLLFSLKLEICGVVVQGLHQQMAITARNSADMRCL